MAFPTHEQVRQVEWSHKYLWDIRFPDAPDPFSSWFPAIDVVEELAKLDTYTFDAHIAKGEIPRSTDMRTIQVTYVDNAAGVLATFMKNWINATILQGGLAVAALETSIKSLQVAKLGKDLSQQSAVAYHVFPKGTLAFEGSSTGEAVTYTTTFVIVGQEVA